MGPGYVLFGVGPGRISRISNIGYYAHSTILDYFFSYGLVGLFLFLCFELIVLKSLFYNKIVFVIAATFLMTYSTHGSAANIEMFLLQGILMASITPPDVIESQINTTDGLPDDLRKV